MKNKYAIEEISLAIMKFGINIDDITTTDPVFMKQISGEINLNINEISKQTRCNLLQRLITESIPIEPLIKRILYGISNNPPMAKSLIEASEFIAQNEDSNPMHKAKITEEQVKYMVYFLVILEVLTTLMLSDKNLAKIISTSIFKKRYSVDSGSTLWSFLGVFFITKGDLFRALKTVSVDPFIHIDLCWRENNSIPSNDDINEFTKENHLSGLNSSSLKYFLKRQKAGKKHYDELCGNIFEALATEDLAVNKRPLTSWFKGNKSSNDLAKQIPNVKAGLTLIVYQEIFEKEFSAIQYLHNNSDKKITKRSHENSPATFWDELYQYSIKGNLVRTELGISKEWVNLYESWNASFVLRYLPKDFHLFLAKLLIPQTISSSPENYIAARTISLWLSISFVNSLIRNSVKTRFRPLNMDFLLNIWGRNNFEYAQNTLFKSTKFDFDSLYTKSIQQKSTPGLYIKCFKMLKGEYLLPTAMLSD